MNEDPLHNNRLPRMTLTFAGIARARLVVLTVAGEDKREAVRRVHEADPSRRRPGSPPTASCGSSTEPPPATSPPDPRRVSNVGWKRVL